MGMIFGCLFGLVLGWLIRLCGLGDELAYGAAQFGLKLEPEAVPHALAFLGLVGGALQAFPPIASRR